MAALASIALNGFLPASSDSNIIEVEEYEKILRIRDQVFAGSHPRLTVPAHVLRKVSPRLPEVPPVPVQNRVDFVPPAIDISSAKLPGLQTNNHVAEQTTTSSVAMLNGPKSLPQPQTPQSTASGIDPIFLTKSDELVRQETVFQRQRLEKQLREQFEKKKSDARNRPHPEEVKPEINISAMLVKVMDAVKPLATAKPSSPANRASLSDSFDENSFYSSRAPDSTPEEGALSEHSPHTKHQVQPRVLDNLDADGLVDQCTRHGQADRRDSPRPTNPRPARTVQSSIPFPYDLRQDRGMLLGIDTVDLTSMDVDDDDEPEYSPPEPAEQYASHNNDNVFRFDYRDPRSRQLRRYSGADQHDKRPGSPLEADMRIVRSHITSPLAPQPSRVSPLAVAKAPPLLQNTRSRNDRNYQNGEQFDSSRQSADYAQAPENSRKKRKLDKKANRMKKRKGNMAGSPEAHIKDEPVSPPPFHDVQPLGAANPRTTNSNVPIYIDDEPVQQQVRYLPAQDRFAQPPPRQIIYEEPPLPRSEPRPYSRASVRSLMRNEQDLRRVASLHNLRAEQPAEYVDMSYSTPTRARVPPYAVVESPYSASARANREPMYVDERQVVREERAMGSPAPVYRMDPNLEVRYRAPELLPPEQKRLVQDQYGNQFYEIMSRQSVVPRQPAEVELYNDNTYTRNDRAGSVFIKPPREKRYVQDMPPPQVSYRRVGEVSRTPVVDARQISNPAHAQRSASVQVAEYAPRHAIYADERIPARAPARIGSVRPQDPRYEEARVPVSRVQSVRPGEREGSVFIDDRSQVRREYVPVQAEQQPVYRRVMQDGQQYYEVQEPRYDH